MKIALKILLMNLVPMMKIKPGFAPLLIEDLAAKKILSIMDQRNSAP